MPEVARLTVTSLATAPDNVAVKVSDDPAFSAIFDALLANSTVTPGPGSQDGLLNFFTTTANIAVAKRLLPSGVLDKSSRIFFFCASATANSNK